MPVTYTSTLQLAQVPVGTDGATANNERNTDMTKLDALFATNAFTAGSVIVANASGKLSQDNARLFWDDTNNRLGIGTNSPLTQLHISSTSTSATQVRLSDTTTPTDVLLRAIANLFDIDMVPATPASAVTTRFYRTTETSGAVSVIFYTGASIAIPVANAVIGCQNTNTYFCVDNGRMGVGTNSIDTSAMLEVASTTGGFLFPRMTTTQRDALSSPTNGLTIFNTTTQKLQVRRSGTTWDDLH